MFHQAPRKGRQHTLDSLYKEDKPLPFRTVALLHLGSRTGREVLNA